MATALAGTDGSTPTEAAIDEVHRSGRAFGAPNEADSRASVGVANIGLEAFDDATWTEVLDGAEGQGEGCGNTDALQEALALTRRLRATKEAARARPNAAAFRIHDAGRDEAGGPAAFDQEDDLAEPQPSHDDKVERGATGMTLGGVLKTPAVMARGWPVNHVSCWQCQRRPGWLLQNPHDVYDTAYRTALARDPTLCASGQEGVEAVLAMANLLEEGDEAEVVARTACCENIDCLLRASLMTPEHRIKWLAGPRRPQDERETARKDQVHVMEENMRLLHALRKSGALSTNKVRHMMRFLALNSQFVQEREKKLIATAMAVAENDHRFGYTFAQPQAFVNRMANHTHGYVMNVLVPHVLDRVGFATAEAWEAHLQRLLDTAIPKAPDIIYALICDENARQGNYEREPAQALPDEYDIARDGHLFGADVQQNGRLVHRIGHGCKHADLFDPRGFLLRMQAAVAATPHYELDFASSHRRLHANAGDVYRALRVSNTDRSTRRPTIKRFEIHVAVRALEGNKNRRVTTSGNGVWGPPTCASLQRQTNVHPQLRYLGVWLAEGYSRAEAELRNSMILQYYGRNNSVGKEPMRSGLGSKECFILRPVAIGVQLLCDPANPPTLKAALRLDELTLASPAALVPLGSHRRQAKHAMGQLEGSSSARTIRKGRIGLVGTPSTKPQHESVACRLFRRARSERSLQVMSQSICHMIIGIQAHTKAIGADALPTIATIGGPALLPPLVAPRAEAVSQANAALNSLVAEWGSGEDAYTGNYDVHDHGESGHPQTLYGHLQALLNADVVATPNHTQAVAPSNSHPIVVALLAPLKVLRTHAALFVSAYEALAAPMPAPMTVANVRDSPAWLDATPSKAIANAGASAVAKATAVWTAMEPYLDGALTQEEFEIVGAKRAWAFERANRAKRHEAGEGAAPDSLEEPRARDRRLYAAHLREVAKAERDARVSQFKIMLAGVAATRRRIRDGLRRQAEFERQQMGLDHRADRRHRTRRPPHLPEAPPAHAEERIAAAMDRQRQVCASKLAEIRRFELGEAVEPFESKWDDAMQVRYGGMAQSHIRVRNDHNAPAAEKEAAGRVAWAHLHEELRTADEAAARALELAREARDAEDMSNFIVPDGTGETSEEDTGSEAEDDGEGR